MNEGTFELTNNSFEFFMNSSLKSDKVRMKVS